MKQRVRLGELLVGSGFMSQEQLDEVLALQKQDGRRLGTLLVEQGIVTETQLTQILSQQLSVPWVSLHHIDFSRQLLNLVPTELATTFCAIPIYVRRIRGQGDALYVAMEDPSNDEAIQKLEEFSGLMVRTMIAPPSDIRAALRAFYELDDEEPEESSAAVSSPPAATPHSSAPPRSAPPSPSSEEPVELHADSDPDELTEPEQPAPADNASAIPPSSEALEPRDSDMPKPKAPRNAPPMLSLTLLDGSTIMLPARTGKKSQQVKPQGMTTHDLIAALRAAGGGNDLRDVLGADANWEKLFAALLALLMRKGLIADWEFVNELKQK